MVRILSTILCTILLSFGVGCSEQEPQQEAHAPMLTMEHAPVPRVLKIVVPENVEGMWQSVKVAVRDLQTGTEDIYSVDIGGSFLLPEEKIRITVETFLPAFVVDGKQITSASNRTTNPAISIVIREEEKEIYHGWLFGLYPDTHAYQHPRYNFTLLGYRPAG